ncbi:MAG: hypothetical protein HYZ04_05990, partial [Rhodospirillales bacterium]|nr:hypothetical protein [Rhodospirillales bacterium]
DPGQLALALEQADLRLFEESGEWLLTLLEPPPGPPPGSPPGPPGPTTKGAPTAPVAAGRPPGKS